MRPLPRPARSTAFLVLLIATAMAATLLRPLVTEGMFFDGVTYANLARNLAQGQGSFWSPYFSTAWIGFHEHPPLGIAILAGVYRLLGTSVYVEKIYGVALAILDAFLVGALWARFRREDRPWPVLLWITTPVVFWAHSNNMLELPQTTFLLLAVLALVAALQQPAPARRGRLASLLAASAVCVACALLVKGPVGLLPLGVPILFWLVFRSPRPPAVIGMTLVLGALVVAALGVALLTPGAIDGVRAYLQAQLIGTFRGARGVDSRLLVLAALAGELGPALGVLVLLKVGVRRLAGAGHSDAGALRPALFFLLLGLAAALPVMLSPRQARHYVVPSLPFLALGVALLGAGEIRFLLSKVGRRSIAVVAVLFLVAAGISLRGAGGVGRDAALISFVKEASARFPPGTTLNSCPDLDQDYPLASYLARYGEIGISSLAQDAPLLVSDGTCPDRQRAYPTPVFAQGSLAVLRR